MNLNIPTAIARVGAKLWSCPGQRTGIKGFVSLDAMALLVPVSAALYRLVEQPCIRFGAGLVQARGVFLKAG